jgi:phenylacetate-CoA ligase
VDPDTIQTVDDLSKIPITTKDTVRHTPLQDFQATNVAVKNCVKLETSGTSGIPLSIYWDIDGLLENKLNMLLLQLDCGDRVFNKRIESHMWTMQFPSFLQRLGIFRTKYISPFAAVTDQLRELHAFHPRTMLALPSFALILAKALQEHPISGIDIERIFTLGELLDDHARAMIEEAFDTEIFDAYGASEVGSIYTECAHHNKHLQGNANVVEIVKNNDVLGTHEEGEVVVTNLLNYAMPMLRYNTEDLGYLLDDKCSCTWRYPLMTLTAGRKSDVIQLTEGRIVSAQEAMHILKGKAYALRQFQVIQNRPHQLSIAVVTGTHFTPTILRELAQEFHAAFGVDLELEIHVVDTIAREASGKYKDFKTSIAS